jgi:outer membrane protein
MTVKHIASFLASSIPVAILYSMSFLSHQTCSQPIRLEQVIKEVCTKSDSARMMKETITKSHETVRQNWSGALPSVSASISGIRMYGVGVGLQTGQSGIAAPGINPAYADSPVTYRALGQIFSGLSSLTAPSAANLFKTALQLSQTIYTFGKIGTAIRVAGEFDKSVRSSTNRSLQQMQLVAVDAFYGVVLSEISLDIAKRSYERKKELYEFLDRNFKLGSGSKAQLLSAKADMKSQVPVISMAREALLNTKMSLNMLMGRPLLDSLVPDTTMVLNALVSKSLPSEKEAVQTALNQRDDLRAIQFLADATRGGAKIYDAMYLPNIAALGSIGIQAGTPEDIVNWDKKTWSVGVGLQWNIFDGFENNAKARQFRSDANKLEIVHDAITKIIEIDVATAISECIGADSNLTATEDALAAAQESYDMTNDNFKQGSGQLVDLQDTENRLRQVEMSNIGARYRLVRSRAALQVAMGNYIVKLEEK